MKPESRVPTSATSPIPVHSHASSIAYRNWGGPEELYWPQEYTILPARLPSNFVRIRVRCISINPIDYKTLAGRLRPWTFGRFPRTPCTDFSGVVIEAGSTSRLKPGDRVAGMLPSVNLGSARQILSIPARQAIAIPDGIDFTQAAALSAAGISAILATQKLQGRRALVIGASGGVGHVAVQLLANRGWSVTGTSKREHAAALEHLGCDSWVDRNSALDAAASGGWDAIIDTPALLMKHHPQHFLNRKGSYRPVYIPDNQIISQMLRSLTYPLSGGFSGRSTGLFLAIPRRNLLASLYRMQAHGSLSVQIAGTYPPSDAVNAFKTAMEGGFLGKICIDFSRSES